jgi:uncharacterized membrane protein YjjB (DUF3815 family)
MELLTILEKGFWFGIAAIGFAMLFNVPQRVLLMIFILGCLGGMTKLILLKIGINIVLATFGGTIIIGLLTIQAAHFKHAPPMVFTIPSVIPMVPGVFAYKMMVGIILLTGSSGSPDFQKILSDTVSNGLNMIFILMVIGLGGSLPLLISRKESVKNLKLINKNSI